MDSPDDLLIAPSYMNLGIKLDNTDLLTCYLINLFEYPPVTYKSIVNRSIYRTVNFPVFHFLQASNRDK